MNRVFCLSAVLLRMEKHIEQAMTSDRKLCSNFKEWKFRSPPSYAALPIDDNPEYWVRTAVKNAVFSKVPTEPLTGNVRLVCASEDALKDILDLDPSVAESEEFISFVAGKYLPEGGLSVCHRYGGYQFGFWADQLGDGRAHILGEYVNSAGEAWQPQLKGSGETPYSRMADGRAVLRSSLRELVASEAAAALGLPTTRAAALVVSDTHEVWRDRLYRGQARPERAAVLLRLARCWVRLGSLEILRTRREPELLKTFVDFIIKHHFPELEAAPPGERYGRWYREVARRNLRLVAAWQGSGFTHGVLNTDNVSLLGDTLDYGPFGWLGPYSAHYTPNASDDRGRYAYDQQPKVMVWNLERFAETVEVLLGEEAEEQRARLRVEVAALPSYVADRILETFLSKLGLRDARAGEGEGEVAGEGGAVGAREGDAALVRELLAMMQLTAADFTMTFRQLAEVDAEQLWEQAALAPHWALGELRAARGWEPWARRYCQRLRDAGVREATRRARMRRVNPQYVPRAWMLQEAIADAEKNDFEKVRFLLRVLRRPYAPDEEAERRGYSAPPPSWAHGIKISCSS